MDMGLIGNCRYNSLIDSKGNVKWLCWPRFDSSFVFGSLVNETSENNFAISPDQAFTSTQKYLTNTNILKTQFDLQSGSFEVVDFAPRFHQYERYYKPNMLIRIVRPISGEPSVRVMFNPQYDYGKTHITQRYESNHISCIGAPEEIRLTTNASLEYIKNETPFVVDKVYYFVLTYGQPLEANLQYTCEEFFERTKNYWHTWVKHCHLPPRFQDEVVRSALILKLHQFEDTGAIIASSTTSIPEAENTVRNWDYRYCWLRDSLFSLSALQKLTQFEETERFVCYLRNLIANIESTDGRLQPLYGISGEAKIIEKTLDHLSGYRNHKPVRIGNQAYEHLQHDVYGEMILAISPLFLDQRFIHDHEKLPFHLLEVLLDKIDEFKSGKDAGLWEFRGLQQVHTFTLLMHWCGAVMVEKISIKFQHNALMDKAASLKAYFHKAIEESCYDPSRRVYTQAAGVDPLDASLLMMVNLGYFDGDKERALTHIEAIKQELATKNGFLHRYIAKDDFGDTHNAFLICSFWLAEAYARMGEQEKAEELFKKLLASSNSLGLYSEDLDPVTGELWGNFPQTYSHVGLINTAFAITNKDKPLW